MSFYSQIQYQPLTFGNAGAQATDDFIQMAGALAQREANKPKKPGIFENILTGVTNAAAGGMFNDIGGKKIPGIASGSGTKEDPWIRPAVNVSGPNKKVSFGGNNILQQIGEGFALGGGLSGLGGQNSQDFANSYLQKLLGKEDKKQTGWQTLGSSFLGPMSPFTSLIGKQF